MSLVNDMLRDLDQRRNTSDSASASIKLMPASEMPVEKKNRILLIVAVVLVVAVSGLAYLWFQQTGITEPRRLNISTLVASTAAPSSPTPAVELANETSAAEQAQEQVQEQTSAQRAETVAPEATPAIAATPNTISAISDTVESTATGANRNSPVVTGEGPDIAVSRAPVQPVPELQSPASGQDREATAAPESSVAQSQSSQQGNQFESPADRAAAPRSVVNQPAPASIKNDAEVSADQRDTMAVQAALRMIADNDVTGAYAHLEQHIINNRYAHQSRETYAKLLMNEGELLAAYNLVESGLGLAPNHSGFKKVKARILIADGQIGEAVNLLSSRAPSIAEDIEYHEILATAQLASRDYRGALITYTSLVQQDQSQGRWWYGYAASQDSLGNASVARQAYNRAVQQPNLSPNLRRRSQERLAALSE